MRSLTSAISQDIPPQFSQSPRLVLKYAEQGLSRATSDLLTTETSSSASLVTGQNGSLIEVRPVNQFVLPLPVSSPHWATDFGDRVRWLIGNQIQKAELTLNPRNLGAIEISISVNNDQTSIHFMAQNSISKDVVESSLWRLREMLEDAGVNLADVDVSQHSNQDSSASERNMQQYSGKYAIENTDVISKPISVHNLSDQYALIDIYA